MGTHIEIMYVVGIKMGVNVLNKHVLSTISIQTGEREIYQRFLWDLLLRYHLPKFTTLGGLCQCQLQMHNPHVELF